MKARRKRRMSGMRRKPLGSWRSELAWFSSQVSLIASTQTRFSMQEAFRGTCLLDHGSQRDGGGDSADWALPP